MIIANCKLIVTQNSWFKSSPTNYVCDLNMTDVIKLVALFKYHSVRHFASANSLAKAAEESCQINAHREYWNCILRNGVRANCKDWASKNDLRSSVWQDFVEDIFPGETKKGKFCSSQCVSDICSMDCEFRFLFFFSNLKKHLFLTWPRNTGLSGISYYIKSMILSSFSSNVSGEW